MKARVTLSVVLDVSKGFGFGVLYHPVIGAKVPAHYPFVPRFRRFFRATRRKSL